ncbi:hypothetical protein [Actinomyces ruminicola]|uniref:Uncharacterized protein n=1 Tax=Actinomyces ruminicola TaxID=332524 RepID=A0A1G9V2S1_9ACTO|nr:hypothetical protein [Actinomyces ruminicola]SDM66165.1 hypothetical protein SAMN04487766_10567 [Actinomyces ruminicola]
MSSTIPTTDNNDSTRATGATAQWPGTSRPRRRVLAILLAITVLCAGVLAWWRPWEQEEEAPPPPEAVCQDVYNTAELNRILGSSIGSDKVQRYGGWNSRCGVISGKPPATNARGYYLQNTIMLIEYWSGEEYDAGNGYKWTDETMAADTENDVQKLNTPELEGNTYLWVRESGSENYVNGIWFRDGFTVVVKLPHPENNLDGPRTTQEAVDIMPELLTYIGTTAQEHHAIPNYTSSKTPDTPDPSNATDTPATEPTATGDQPTSTGDARP